ncbi:MOSC domain-containing protein [Arenibaculum sp.]|uniref:MOSC domain-containing protein n=1 Tax=Arenibaculum sp. TaxID=2865862 RepID=UPI002E154DE7|nr:MOSC domain-containing protein [Arenibaculum sp.]
MSARLTAIFRYPIKALSGTALDGADLVPGAGLPDDRRFAIGSGGAGTLWATLERHPRLAALETRYDAPTGLLTILRKGRPVARGRIDTPTGRMVVDQFLAAYLKGELPGLPHLAECPGGAFDVGEPAVSLLNLASVQDLERRMVKAPLDPARFRANLLIDGFAAWAEASWPGRRIAIGTAVLEAFAPVERTEATNVEPGTGDRGLNVPMALVRGTGRPHCGVHARVASAGRVQVGDEVRLLD